MKKKSRQSKKAVARKRPTRAKRRKTIMRHSKEG